jgi:hypothetical protein
MTFQLIIEKNKEILGLKFKYQVVHLYLTTIEGGVPDPGSGAFLTPGSIWDG